MELIIVTGLSGAGKSCVMKALEDIGYFCADNIPTNLIPVFAKLLKEADEYKRVAVVTDIRAGLTPDELKGSLLCLENLSVSYSVLFLDCDEEILLSRYKQTRRNHPLMKSENDTLSDAISSEKNILSPMKAMADFVLDTTEMSLSDCKSRINSIFSENSENKMFIRCVSFGFKHGIPKDADYIFDVRFLPNPFYIPELKERTGLDEEVRAFVMGNSSATEFERNLHSLISFAASECFKEGRRQLIIGIGCTGGHHRSVTFTERLGKMLRERNYNVCITHRDISK